MTSDFSFEGTLQLLVSKCESAMKAGDYRGAGVIARGYSRTANDLADEDPDSAKVLLAYAYLMICRSILGLLETAQIQERPQLLEMFYVIFHSGFQHFQDLLLLSRVEMQWDESSPHFPYFEELRKLDSIVNERYGEKDCTAAAKRASERLHQIEQM